MEKTLFLLVLILTASTFVSGQKDGSNPNGKSKQRIPQINLQAEEQKLKEMRRQWDKFFESKDANAQASMFAVDGILIAGGSQPIEGREAFRQSALRVLKRTNISHTHEPAKVEVSSSGDMAYEIGSWKETWDEPDGHTTLTGRYFAVWKKIEGSWQVAAKTLRVYACSGSSYCK